MVEASTRSGASVVNTRFETRPLVVHAAGGHSMKPYWPPIRDAFFAGPERRLGACPDLHVFTCNNGHEAMGMFERSLDHIGVPYTVSGQGIDPWVNSEAKPRAVLDALAEIDTDTVMYVDSRDGILLDAPHFAFEAFEEHFDCDLVFGAARFSYPPLPEFEAFEKKVAPDLGIDEIYLQGGTWIGRTDFCREFFTAVAAATPVEQASDSEQGLLRQAFADFHPRVQLDYECHIFQNVGFLFAPTLEVRDATGEAVEVTGLL